MACVGYVVGFIVQTISQGASQHLTARYADTHAWVQSSTYTNFLAPTLCQVASANMSPSASCCTVCQPPPLLLPLSPKNTTHTQGVKSLAAAVPEAKSLTHLVLTSTGLLDEGAAALAAALQQPPASPLSPLLSPVSCSSSSSPSFSIDGGSSSNNRAGCGNGGANSSSSSSSALQVLDLSKNIICDTGAEQIAAAVTAGVLPQLRQLAVVENRYPFDWSTVLQLQGLQVLQPGLRVDLGAPSGWCVAPAAAAKTRGSASGTPNNLGGSLSAAVENLRHPDASAAPTPHLPAGWTSTAATGSDGCSDGGCDAAAAAADAAGGAAATNDALSVASEDLCGVCFDAPNALLVQGCGHKLCIGCYRQLVKAAAAAAAASSSSRHQQGSTEGGSTGCAACPFCRAPMAGFKYSAWVQEEERLGGV